MKAYNSNKFQPCSSTCVFLGYDYSRKIYKCYHIPTKCVYWSRHVVFVEESFLFAVTSDVLPFPPPPTQVITTSNIFSSAHLPTPDISSNPLDSFSSASSSNLLAPTLSDPPPAEYPSPSHLPSATIEPTINLDPRTEEHDPPSSISNQLPDSSLPAHSLILLTTIPKAPRSILPH